MSETPEPASAAGRKLLRKDERRSQLIRAAARAFCERGFAGTSLDDVAAEAGVTKMIIYRHFDSKRDLYQAVLVDARERIVTHVGAPEEFGQQTMTAMIQAAQENPDGYRLLYRHAAREPEFADYAAQFGASVRDGNLGWLKEYVADPARREWLAALLPAVTHEALMSWLDAGQPVSPEELQIVLNTTTRTLAMTVIGEYPTPPGDRTKAR